MKVRNSIQLRTMLLFCAAAGILLVGSFVVAYILFDRAVREQLDRQLTENGGFHYLRTRLPILSVRDQVQKTEPALETQEYLAPLT